MPVPELISLVQKMYIITLYILCNDNMLDLYNRRLYIIVRIYIISTYYYKCGQRSAMQSQRYTAAVQHTLLAINIHFFFYTPRNNYCVHITLNRITIARDRNVRPVL